MVDDMKMSKYNLRPQNVSIQSIHKSVFLKIQKMKCAKVNKQTNKQIKTK